MCTCSHTHTPHISPLLDHVPISQLLFWLLTVHSYARLQKTAHHWGKPPRPGKWCPSSPGAAHRHWLVRRGSKRPAPLLQGGFAETRLFQLFPFIVDSTPSLTVFPEIDTFVNNFHKTSDILLLGNSKAPPAAITPWISQPRPPGLKLTWTVLSPPLACLMAQQHLSLLTCHLLKPLPSTCLLQ